MNTAPASATDPNTNEEDVADMTSTGFPYSIVAVALLGILAAACSIAGSTERPDAPRELVIHAAEYSFRAVDTIRAGMVSVHLVNDGAEVHHVQLVRIGREHSFEEFRESAANRKPLPPWVTPVGGPQASSSGVDTKVVLDLPAGQYAMLCFIPSFDDRIAHYAKGMIRPLVVLPSGAAGGREPEADGRIVLTDYSFGVSPTIRAGRHTLRVENAAAQAHEVVIERLMPGKTMEDLRAWAKRLEGPPPVEPNGGTTVIAPGGVNLMTATFIPGEYVMVCFASDASDGRSHVAHGMVYAFRVY
jgi:hypothetical protein